MVAVADAAAVVSLAHRSGLITIGVRTRRNIASSFDVRLLGDLRTEISNEQLGINVCGSFIFIPSCLWSNPFGLMQTGAVQYIHCRSIIGRNFK